MEETHLPTFGAVEDLMLGILRPFFQGHAVSVEATYFEGMPLPAVVPLHANPSGSPFSGSDQRHTESAVIEVNTFCDGIEAERDNAELQEACRHALRNAQKKQLVVPGVGCINQIQGSHMATRKSGWGNGNLPQGVVRYEATYGLLLRPDKSTPATNRFITSTQP